MEPGDVVTMLQDRPHFDDLRFVYLFGSAATWLLLPNVSSTKNHPLSPFITRGGMERCIAVTFITGRALYK